MVGTSSLVLAVVLVATGLATAALLHWRTVASLDEVLLAAGHAYGRHPWQAEHSASPVEVGLYTYEELGLNLPTFEGDEEHPIYRNEEGQRVLWLPVEVERGAEVDDVHRIVVARAPKPGPIDTVGPLLVLYGGTAALLALMGGAIQASLLRRAVAPLERAALEVRRVMGAGRNQRVEVRGPTEVQVLLEDVNALLDRLDTAFAAQARFTAEAAHELRTPVAILRGEIDVALRRPRSVDELEETLRSVGDEVDRLQALVEGLMALARLDTGEASEGRHRVSVAELLEAAARQGRPPIEGGGGRLHMDLEGTDLVEVDAHEALVVAALANLLRNAAGHAPGAEVWLSARRVEGRIEIQVEDAGQGIPEAERDVVFDRLVRGAQARGRVHGLGLGLALTREVARRHGGDCVAGASPHGGASLCFSLPLP